MRRVRIGRGSYRLIPAQVIEGSELNLDVRGDATSGAAFSHDGVYRYALWRELGDMLSGNGALVVIGLNPSTADETMNDPTVTRCIKFARREGKARLVMLNLFAFRATDPAVMKACREPIGADNDEVIRRFANAPDALVLAAWGVHGSHLGRAGAVMKQLRAVHCLGRNKDGGPKHPLYIRADQPFEVYHG